MDSQDTANSMTEPTSGHEDATVKPNAPLPPQGFQARPQGLPPSPRNSINNGPVNAPRPGQPLRRLDSRSSLGPPAAGQFVQLRPYGPPRPPGGSFPPRSPQPGQLPPQNPLHPANQRFPHSPGIPRGPPPQVGGQRPPFAGNYQQQPQQQQPQRGSNDHPRFQRPDIAPQNGAPLYRPGQELPAFPRQLLRNDSSLSLQRRRQQQQQQQQQQLSSNEETKQPTRPRIVVERMTDINESGVVVEKPEGYLQRKRSDMRENGENDDDDDVVMDNNERSSRSDADGAPEGLVNGSKSPSTLRKQDEPGSGVTSRPGTATVDSEVEKNEDNQDAPTSRPISAISDDKVSKGADDAITAVSQSRPTSALSDKEKEERHPSRPPSTVDSNAKDRNGATSPLVDDLKSDKSRPPSSTSAARRSAEEIKIAPGSAQRGDANLKTPSDTSRSSTPSHLEAPRNAEQESAKTPSKSPDKSRSSTPAGSEPPGSAELNSRTPFKTPDKSRSSTPAGLERPRNAEQESRTPTRTSCTRTPAAPSPSLSPSPSPSPNVENELENPAKTPDKSPRSTTPAGAQPGNNEIGFHESAETPQADKSDDGMLQAKEAFSRPTSSLSLANSTADRGSKSPKSPRSPARSPESQQGKLSVPGSVTTPPKSPDSSVKGFDNGQQRSVSSRTTPVSPRSPRSPKSPVDSAKQAEGEKKRTSFVVDDAVKKSTETADKPPSATSPSKPTTPAAKSRATPPAKLSDEKAEQKSSERKAVQNGSAGDSQAVPTTNGIAESPTKKSKDSDKRSTAGSPTKSPSKSAKSVPRTPDTPPSTTQEKKKVPMNKIQVGAAPSPNLKTVRSKIGSLDNASYKPGGGKVKIENRKLDFSKAQPKIAAKNEKYTPSGGDKKISQVKLQWNAKPKVGSLENATYKPGGGDKKIETVKLDFKDKAKSKVGSKDNAKHVPGGGGVKSATSPKTPQEAKNDIPMQKIEIKAESKVGSLDNVKHKPGGGDKKIFNDRDYLRQTSSNVESLNGSGSQVHTPVDDDRQLQDEPRSGDLEMPQPPPSTPTRARPIASPSSVVTPRAVRSGLAKSPDAATPRIQFAQETEATSSAEGRASKTPPPDVANGSVTPKNSRSPRSPVSPRPPSSLQVKSTSEKSFPGTPTKSSPGTPRKASPKELHLPKLASSPVPQEASSQPDSHSKITLPKLIEPSSQAARMAY